MADVDRQMIQSLVTDSRKDEFDKIISQLAAQTEREDRVKLLSACLEQLSSEGRKLFELTRKKESQHIVHVRKTLDEIPEQPKDRRPHDFSKDDLYFLATSAKFDYDIRSHDMEQLFRMEVERHYRLEPHHEQFEQINGRECTVDDVREMVIDRMSRNIQTNSGFVHVEQMENYIPNFPLGDNKKKQDMFRQFVTKYKPLTEKTYQELVSQ